MKYHAAMSNGHLSSSNPSNSDHGHPGGTDAANSELRADTPVELRELAAAIDALPPVYRDSIMPSMQRVVQCSTRRRRILNLVQEALSQLRLDMKYLIFDLEATRRERDEYRERLENE